jgi:hypothetical protein
VVVEEDVDLDPLVEEWLDPPPIVVVTPGE